MCPDKELLSAYADGEVPEPWQGQLAQHLSTCPACRAALDSFRRVSVGLTALVDPQAEAEAAERCLARLREEGYLDRLGSKPPTASFWRRSVRLPLPILAAAALALFLTPSAISLALLRGPGRPLAAKAQAPRDLISSAREAAPAPLSEVSYPSGQGEFSDMESLLRYLDSTQLPVTISVELPSKGSYGFSGPSEFQRIGPATARAKAKTVNTSAGDGR